MNLVTSRPGGEFAMGGRSQSGRNLFLVPWRGRALFGTWESGVPASPNDRGVSRAEVDAFIRELNEAFPTIELRSNDVTLVHHGIVPAVDVNGRIALEGHEQIRDHARSGMEGVMSVVGAKYTTARGVAERVTDQLLQRLGRPKVASRTASVPLPGGTVGDLAGAASALQQQAGGRLSAAVATHLVAAYGTGAQGVLEASSDRPNLRECLSADSPVIGAELVWAVRHEMASTLVDAVVRRTPLGALGYPGDEAVARAVAIVADELRWSTARCAEETAALEAFYAWTTPPTAA
jgi:glycerol-3-phosphate dehydrogenase